MEISILSKYWIWYLIITLAAVAAGIITYRKSYPPLSRFWRIALTALRVMMIVLVGLFIIEPLINLYSYQVIKPKLAVLVDNSRSMGLISGGRTRIELADTLADDLLRRSDSEYKIFKFAGDLSESEKIPTANDLAGDATSITGALRGLAAIEDIDQYGAAVLISDGRQNLGDDPVVQAAKLNFPVYSLTIGENLDQSNLAIDNVVFPSVAYSGDPFEIEAVISAEGISEKKTTVYLKTGGQAVAGKPFDIPREGRKVKVRFEVEAPPPGDIEYSISVGILPGEINTADNQRLFVVRVLKSKLKIFLGTSALDWEFKFIKQALSGFDEFEIAAVYPEGSGRFSGPGVPSGAAGLENYDVVILVDSAPRALRISASDLEKYVEEGGALVYIAGGNSASDIALFGRVLPFDPANPVSISDEFFIDPVPDKKQHSVILLDDDPDISINIWRSLAPISNVITGFRPVGDVLLETKSLRKTGKPFPVLTVSNFGRGRVAAVTGYPIWRSYFGSVKDPVLAKAIPGFWRNLMKWVSATEPAENFKLVTDRKVYRLGEPARLTAFLYDQSNNPRNGALVTVSAIPDGQENQIKDVVLNQSDNGVYSGEITDLPSGGYRLMATATAYGDTLGQASGRITVEQYSLEMISSSPDYNLTRRISEATGGKAYTAADFSQFADDLKLAPFEREKHTRIKPFGMPLFLIIVLCGLCIEWGIRKRLRLP